MINTGIRLPFRLPEVYGGFAEGSGLIWAEPNALVLEFQVKDAVLGMIKSDPKRIRIPFDNLQSVRYKRNWFVSRFIIHVNTMDGLKEFPNVDEGEIKLKIRRKKKEAALNLASNISMRLSEYQLAQLRE